jgi:anaerobic selenocysteine-containing dehydrogenase
VPDGSIRVLFIDESAPGEYIPWSAIAPKMAANQPLVVAFAWTAEGYGKHARFTLPAPVFGEALDDIPAAVDGVAAAFRLSTPLVTPQAAVVNPPEFIAELAGLKADGALRERADAIHQTARGQVFTPADSKTTPLKEMATDDFWKALNAGACWMDERAPLPNGRGSGGRSTQYTTQSRDREGAEASGPLAIVVGESAGPPLSSPLSSKLYRESSLRQSPERIALAPATARAAGVSDGSRAVLETGGARLPVVVALDAGLPPDVVRIAAGSATGDLQGAFARGKVVPA